MLFALMFDSVDEILKCDHWNESYPKLLFIILHKVILVFEPVDELLRCDH